MALELNKLTSEMDAMGRILAEREQAAASRIQKARQVLHGHPQMSDDLARKIARARQIDAWRRGALPVGRGLDERHRPINVDVRATLIAVDGSQIYLDRHGIAPYFLLNIGSIILRQGSGAAPQTAATPLLFYQDHDLYNANGLLRPPEYVNSQRARREISVLADLAEAERRAEPGRPIVALVDGPLLPWLRSEGEDDEALAEEMEHFVAQLRRLRNADAIPVGYVDRPESAYVLRILELLTLPVEEISREKLRTGDFIQLTDRQLFADLGPNERTALFTSNSDANDRYAAAAGGDRIAFGYANMTQRPEQLGDVIARLEVPGWVAAQPERIDLAQAAVYADCKLRGFPYVLDQAHELAVVRSAEKAELERMLGVAMMRRGLRPALSTKAQGKQLLLS